MPEISDDSEFVYIAGLEVSSWNPPLPHNMTAKTIPLSKYAVFEHTGTMERLKDTYSYIYGAWLPGSGYALAELDTIEL